jgi:hypothetical protein
MASCVTLLMTLMMKFAPSLVVQLSESIALYYYIGTEVLRFQYKCLQLIAP